LESFKKCEEKLFHELKRGSIHLRKRKAPIQKVNPQPLVWQTWNLSVRLSHQCQLSDKVTVLFEPRHARRYGRISFEIGRSMGGSVATSK